MFQFQYGAIIRPPVLLPAELAVGFQFQYGAIISFPHLTERVRATTFQFQYGAIIRLFWLLYLYK